VNAKVRENAFVLVGRLLVGGVYLNAGLTNLTRLDAQAGYAASKGVPEAKTLVFLASLLLLAGGLSLITGFLPRLGVLAMVAFLVPVNLIMHNFWGLPAGFQRQSELYHFLANVGLLGSTLMFLAIPRPWALSLDRPPAGVARLLLRLTGRAAVGSVSR
jgi:putative oxidoreductase